MEAKADTQQSLKQYKLLVDKLGMLQEKAKSVASKEISNLKEQVRRLASRAFRSLLFPFVSSSLLFPTSLLLL